MRTKIRREEIYPMGTVVRLQDKRRNDKLSEYSYMITERFVMENKEDKEYYEYKGVVYPLGSQDGKGFLFNNEQIGRVEFVGYETEMDKEIVNKIMKKLKAEKITKKIIDNK